MKISIDLDDTILPLVPKWIGIFNNKYNQNLKMDNITEWDISCFINNKYKNKLYKIIENPKIYDDIKPYPYALETIRLLRELNFEIIYCTDSTIGVSGRKKRWLVENNFWEQKDHYVETKSKFLIMSDMIIDDNPKHILESNSELKVLYNQPWNRNYNWNSRINNWKELIDLINEYKEKHTKK